MALALVAASAGFALLLPSRSYAAPAGSAVTKSVTATRSHLEAGTDHVVDTRKISVTVDATTGLRNREGVNVSWTGAHPTGGIFADANSRLASREEYPMVLLQCRGTSDTIDPTTCWTQTPEDRIRADYGTSFPAWRVDRYAPPDERHKVVDAPDPRPAHCPAPPPAERWVPWRAADGTVFSGGTNACAGVPPEATSLDPTTLPSNATYATTGLDGSGSITFNIRDATDNATLGCTDKVACALVAVPIMGISCDVSAASLPAEDRPAAGAEADAAQSSCAQTGFYAPGSNASSIGQLNQLAVSGTLWWSQSNWRNRLIFPVQLAQPANVCDLLGGTAPAQIYGSELMIQATTQWTPHFCLDPKAVPVQHVQTGEPQARNLLATGSIGAALVSDPPGSAYTRPTVHAPIAVTGFAISYAIDNADKKPYRTLKLTPRLLAKLMTESYFSYVGIQSDYAALSKNPQDVSIDPEFIALNPGVGASTHTDTAAELFSISSDSDVIHALTSYITADPEARAWLDGKPDPWGMVVNPNYKGISLPVDSWPLLDTYVYPFAQGINNCLADSPAPYLPLVASPVSRLASISLALQFALPNSQVVCQDGPNGGNEGEKLVAGSRQNPGFRFEVGLTSLADANRYGLDTAALQTHVSSGSGSAFTDGSGRSFATPTDASVHAAVDTAKPDPTSKSWPIPYATLRSDTAASDAYPGTAIVYADVPTTGLDKPDAQAFSQFLSFTADAGQVPGDGVGQLPTGYLPMTSANGLGGQVAYTKAAAVAVAAQAGQVPNLDGTFPGSSTTSPPPSTGGSGGGSTSAPMAAAGAGGGAAADQTSGGRAAGSGNGNGGSTLGAAGPGGLAAQQAAAAAHPFTSNGGSSTRTAGPAPATTPRASTTGLSSNLLTALVIVLIGLALLAPLGIPLVLYLSRRGEAG
jgi:hypothetical protein